MHDEIMEEIVRISRRSADTAILISLLGDLNEHLFKVKDDAGLDLLGRIIVKVKTIAYD